MRLSELKIVCEGCLEALKKALTLVQLISGTGGRVLKQEGTARKQRATVYFEGRVQGVGFRFTTVDLASNFDVSGFVRNEMDGSVMIVAEGKPAAIRGLLEAIRHSHLERYLTDHREQWTAATGEFDGFIVQYGW